MNELLGNPELAERIKKRAEECGKCCCYQYSSHINRQNALISLKELDQAAFNSRFGSPSCLR
jgi:hypothetical protein